MADGEFDPDEVLGRMRELAGSEDNANEVVALFRQLDEYLQHGGWMPRDWMVPVGGDPYVPPELEACEAALDALREWVSAERPFELAAAHPRSYAAGYAQAARDALEILNAAHP